MAAGRESRSVIGCATHEYRQLNKEDTYHIHRSIEVPVLYKYSSGMKLVSTVLQSSF